MKQVDEVPVELRSAVDAARGRKAADLKVLDVRDIASFADYFVLLTAANARQAQAIADAVEERLRAEGHRARHVEGYGQAEWILLDYVDFVVHVFSPVKREFYDLERLWRDGRVVEIPEAAA